MTVKHEKRTTSSSASDEELLQPQIEQIHREIHEFLGLLGELANDQPDFTRPHYREVVLTTLHTVPAIISRLENLNQTLKRERLIYNVLYTQNNQQPTLERD